MFKLNEDLKTKLQNALEAKDLTAFSDAVAQLAAESGAQMPDLDTEVLAKRGVRQLTSKEKEFYNSLIEGQRDGTIKNAINNIAVVMPETIIDEVFTDIEQNHPLLSKIDIKKVNAKVKVLFTTADTNTATWGTIESKITAEGSFGFEELDATQLKLSAYMAVPQAYLELGPTFIDSLTRTYLYEAIARELEKGIITNLKSTTGPIGMMADMSAGATSGGVTTYTAKAAIKVTDWTPSGLATALKKMAKTRKGNDRPLSGLYLVVNPSDYFTIVKPAICVQNASGDWVDRQPYAIDIVQSAYVTAGKAILGIDKAYVLGVASETKGRIETSDDYQFLDDTRVYKIKLYANGQPKDNNAFQVIDISGLKEASLFVTTVKNTVTTGGAGA